MRYPFACLMNHQNIFNIQLKSQGAIKLFYMLEANVGLKIRSVNQELHSLSSY